MYAKHIETIGGQVLPVVKDVLPEDIDTLLRVRELLVSESIKHCLMGDIPRKGRLFNMVCGRTNTTAPR